MNGHWPIVKLSEVLRPILRVEIIDPVKEYRLLGVRLDGQGPFLREIVTGSETAATKLFCVKAGDFIYSRLFAWRGAFGIIGKEFDGAYVSGEFPTFQSDASRLDAYFLRFWFQLPGTLAAVNENCSGSTPLTRNRFKEEFFLALQIPLPPISEQRRVVARIDKIFALISEAKHLRAQTVTDAETLLASARAAFFKTIPKDPTLKEACADVTDGTHDTPIYINEGIPFLTGKDISPLGLNFVGVRYISQKDHERFSKHCPIERGDVLLTLIGTTDKVAIVNTDRPFSIKNVGLLKPNNTMLDSRYLFHFLQSTAFKEQAISYAKRTVQEFVGLKKLRTAKIPLPPLAEQRRIVGKLDALEAEVYRLKCLQAETANELNALLPSIFDRAFRGEL
jgi:type I restriction enzyme S subunit